MGDIPVELLETHILLLGVDDHIPDSELAAAAAVAAAVDYDVDDVDAMKQL